MKDFDDRFADRASRNPTWAEVRAARLKERKYPCCPTEAETLFERIRHGIEHWHWRDPIARLQWKRERMQKGWSERDWWSIDRHFARMIAETARKYRDGGHGYPFMRDDEGNELAEVLAVSKWNALLTEMADGFDNYAKGRLDWEEPLVKRAMVLFAEYFQRFGTSLLSRRGLRAPHRRR